MLPSKITGPWRLSDLSAIPKNGLTVFSCFHGGGGSSLGYKLAGFDVLGGVEVDPEMMSIYRANHQPKHSFMIGIQDFNKIPLGALPEELLRLDVLDGSPPCSSFSMAGVRERDWGKKKVFREGQANQVLDDLFFHFIEAAERLRPKVVVAENVKGLIQGSARGYVKEIFQKFHSIGYDAQLFLLNSSRMGVPQVRERTFFIARRMDLGTPPVQLDFQEEVIPLKKAFEGLPEGHEKLASPLPKCLHEDFSRLACGEKKRYFSFSIAHPELPCSTLTSKTTLPEGSVVHWDRRKFSPAEAIRIQTFPEDYDFQGMDPGYVLGMSVPPFMMMRAALKLVETIK